MHGAVSYVSHEGGSFGWLPAEQITRAVATATRLQLPFLAIEGRQGLVILRLATGATVYILDGPVI